MPPRKSPGKTRPTAELKATYDKFCREFSAADLQKYTVVDEERVPMEEVIAAVERDYKQLLREQRRGKREKG